MEYKCSTSTVHTGNNGLNQRGDRGSRPPLPWKITSGYTFPILVRTTLEKQLDPKGPIASRGRFVQPIVKYDDD